MEIGNDTKEKVLLMVKEGMSDATATMELECIIQPGKIKRNQFMNLLQYFRSVNKNIQFEEDTLTINFNFRSNSYRLELTGKQNISNYCMTNSLELVPSKNMNIINKKWIQNEYIDDYGIKVNLKQENIVEDELKKEMLKSLYHLKKYYRFKKRFSIKSENDMFRYDLTIVKSSSNTDATSIVQSGVMNSGEMYEIEIEVLNYGNGISQEDFVKIMMKECGRIICIMNGQDYILSNKEKNIVLDEYLKLCNIDSKTPSYYQFVGPMPITLEKKNLVKQKLGVISILENYTVTDKADGERALLFFASSGKGFLIYRHMDIENIGIENKLLSGTLLDGEYITSSLDGKKIKTFACFDVYYDRNKTVYELPLIDNNDDKDSRYKRMKKIMEQKTTGDKKFKMIHKEFLHSDNIFKDCEKLLKKEEVGEMEYKIDGLIFTPRDLAVGQIYTDGVAKLGGTWMKTFKWKPPKDNSIDFYVRVEKNKANGDIVDENDCKILNLYVNYDIISSEKITPFKYINLLNNLTNEETKVLVKATRYQKKLFAPDGDKSSRAYVKVDEKHVIRALNKDIIYDNTVVEFTYKDSKWIPLRVRKDKTEGNAYHTAMNVWNSMINPVSDDMITGKEKVEMNDAELFDEDVYYNRMEQRDKSLSKPMLDFHNHWVKNISLISKFKNKESSVLDIACGKGNDYQKYLSANFRTIIGIDKSEDNIMDANDGAYSRILRNISKGFTRLTSKHKIAFIPLDCSKVIDTALINSINNVDIQKFAKVLWGYGELDKSNILLKPFYGIANQKMDIVTCQFAIHYFFENKLTLNNLIENINGSLKPGGYFVGTSLDGLLVDSMFKSRNTDIIEGKTIGRTLWQIEKKYTRYDTNDYNNNYGLKIKVYMETINKPFEEYLVDYELLKYELAKYNILPLTENDCKKLNISQSSTGTFKELFHEMENSDIKTKFTESAKQMTEEQKEYSFMNRWFIFKKY
jgi:SAM-dependent methyltransferase